MEIVEGAFVKALFPTDEKPRRPGLLHICYCVGATRALAIVAYTTSRPWPADEPRPLGVRVFAAEEAHALNQRPFVLDLRRLAKLPLTGSWFPEIDVPGRGIVAIAPFGLRDELHRTLVQLLRRHRELVRFTGQT
ncbi:MAG TPA: hypothetical protein VFY87_05205 [Geminicoccaceae bacterium]|nr:hypothetical protein [Geminicoccaceae bacterium]